MLDINNTNLAAEAVNDDAAHITLKLGEAENLTEEARKLLVHCGGALSSEGIRQEALVLERWLESYRRGVSAAQKLTDSGPELLEDMAMRMRQALDELHRFEEEGGNTAFNKSQQAQMDEINHAMVAIQQLSASLKDASLVSAPRKLDAA